MARTVGAAVTTLIMLVVLLAAAAGAVATTITRMLTDPFAGVAGTQRSALAQIPPAYLALYQRAAATCPGLPWSVLAGIGRVESDHGQAKDQTSKAGALGPMQFLPSTFAAYDHPIPPGGVVPPTPWDPVDAIYAAARMLCANGARGSRNLYSAIFAYNHSNSYVALVWTFAAEYQSETSNTPAPCAGLLSPHPGSPALAAIWFACSQLGKRYVWGGTGPDGWDCSGLTQAAYAAAGIQLPRVAQAQYDAGPLLPAGTPLQPGDLVFFGTTPKTVTHVGLAVSPTRMVDAPHSHAEVRVEDIGRYLAATRPAAR